MQRTKGFASGCVVSLTLLIVLMPTAPTDFWLGFQTGFDWGREAKLGGQGRERLNTSHGFKLTVTG
ncbi:MAG TPA: hypothetical protein DEF45_23765 [Rhodopirellula sp.]|nr:hypothetical protein [Rhodopirellula sp.]